MSKFTGWYRNYVTEISWWVIGWLSFAVIDGLLKEQWGFAALNTALIVVNYKLWKKDNA